MDCVIGIAESHGVCHAAAKDATDCAEIKLLEFKQYDTYDNYGDNCEQKPQDKPQRTLGTDDSVKKLRTESRPKQAK